MALFARLVCGLDSLCGWCRFLWSKTETGASCALTFAVGNRLVRVEHAFPFEEWSLYPAIGILERHSDDDHPANCTSLGRELVTDTSEVHAVRLHRVPFGPPTSRQTSMSPLVPLTVFVR